jgi:lantibiotic modifying enzyme
VCGSNAVVPLTGFAHGNAGIGCALLELAEITGELLFKQAAHAAFDYERSVFSHEHGNWPDLRTNATSGFVTAWCHGAPGVGLSRLCALRRVNSGLLVDEAIAALGNTRAYGFGSNHTLCHGDLGNADILLYAAKALNDVRWSVEANQIAAGVIESASETGWICGNPLGVESPGLMTGIAGIGYTFLRLADPARIPSVLALEPPVLL